MLFVTYLQAVCELSTRSEKEDYKYTETSLIGKGYTSMQQCKYPVTKSKNYGHIDYWNNIF